MLGTTRRDSRRCIHFGDVIASETRPSPAFAPNHSHDRGRGPSISRAQDIDAGGVISAASLLFAPGERPDKRAIAAFARSHSSFSISLDPTADSAADGGRRDGIKEGEGNWLELLANGLTFDVVGLAPGTASDAPPRVHMFGLTEDFEIGRMEAVRLQPGPHLAEGRTMLPVVRSLAWLAAQLAGLPGTRAVAWHAARSWCAPGQYRDSVLRWIEGGVFPGLGLAALAPMPDGGMQSQGLALLTGQELRLEPELATDRTAGAKIALRLMHWLVENGRLEAKETLPGPDGRPLQLEPSANGRFVRVWRG